MKWGVPWDWLLAILMLLAIEGALRWLSSTGRITAPQEWNSLRYVERMQIDVEKGGPRALALVGSSMAAPLSPRIILEGAQREGLPADFATRGASTRVVLYLTESLILPRLQPRVLVYAIDTQSVNEHGLRRRQEDQVLAAPRLWLEEPFRFRMALACLSHSAIYRHQFSLREALVHPWRISLGGRAAAPPTRAGGWALADTPHVYEAEADHQLGPRAESDLRALHRACERAGTFLVWTNLPLPQEYEGYWADGHRSYERYLARLTALAAELSVPLVDLNDRSWPKETFVDSHHLEPEAGKRISKMLGEALRTHPIRW